MPCRLSRFLPTVVAGFILIAVTACGGKSSKPPTPTPTPVLIKPQAGQVITNPTAAQSFIYQPRSTVQESNGDILITDGGSWDRTGAKVLEMNPQGKVIWVYTGGLEFPHSAYPVPGTNNILISDTGNDRVIEINRQGKILWDTDNLGGGKDYLGQGTLSNGAKLLYPNDAVVLPNNNILISSRFTNSVYEVSKSGKVTWSCSRFMFRQHNARLLPNGNLMVADSDNGRVLIINHACNKILFNYGGTNAIGVPNLLWPRSFQPYPGGNYIIGDSLHDRIIEINPQKQVIKQWTNLPTPFYVTVLPDGNLLTQDTDIHGAVVLGQNGKIVASYPTTDPTQYPTSIVNPGFEIQTPRGWLQGDLLSETLPAGVRADMTFDTKVKHSGNSSGRINWTAKTGHLGLWWYQTVSVTPGRTYHFTGWIKTKNLQPCAGCDYGVGTLNDGSAYYQASFLDPSNPQNPSPPAVALGSQLTGTHGWTQVSQTFTVPAGVTELQLEARLDGKGTVWFDDTSLS